MIQINLLPVREWRRKEIVRQQISIYLLTMVFIAISLIGTFGFLENLTSKKQNQKLNLEKRKTELAYVEKELKDSKENQELIATKFSTIEKLQISRGNIVSMFNRLVLNVPNDRVWLEDLHYRGSSIAIKGIAMDNQSVALLMKKLEFTEVFKNISLDSTDRKKYEQIDLMYFTIQSSLDFSKKENK
jgi:type IV pilus assembly protein PilN